MLFNKKIEPRCEYCLRGEFIKSSEAVACHIHGVMPPDEHCRHFIYDPISRVPDAPRSFTSGEYTEEDFSL
jgi:hypothetical protein